MQEELNIISLNDIMNKIRKSEIAKTVQGPSLTPPLFLQIDKIIVNKPIEIGECYINNIENYSTRKLISPVSVNIDTLINNSDYEQFLSSSSTTITRSCSKTTQLSVGLDIGKKFSLYTKFFIGELSEETSLTFHVNTSKSCTETQTITKTIPSQSIKVRPKSCAHVKAIMMNTEIIGEVMVCVGLSRYEKGNAYITKPEKKIRRI